MPRIRVRVHAAHFAFLLVATSACDAILGIDFEGTRAAADGDTFPLEAGIGVETGGPPARSRASGDEPDYLSQKPALDALRVRIGDPPDRPEGYFTSKSWIFWVDNANAGHALRPGNGARRTFAGTFNTPGVRIVANDDFIVRTSTASSSITDLSTMAQVDTMSNQPRCPSPVALDQAILSFQLAESDTYVETTAWAWKAPRGPDSGNRFLTAIKGRELRSVGRSGEAAYFVDVKVPTNLVIATVDQRAATVVPLTEEPSSVRAITQGLVVSHGKFQLLFVPPSGPAVDLTGEIAKATSTIPASERIATGPPASLGDWILFPAGAGVLAFRHRDLRLVAVQLRSPTDAIFQGLSTVRAGGAVVFTIPTAPSSGLFYVAVDSLLPP